MLNLLPPRSFSDLTVPNRADGTPIFSSDNRADYDVYVRWLADYLHYTPLPLTPAQEAWLREAARTPDNVIFECSDVYGYTIDQVEGVEVAFEEGETWQHYQDRMRQFWEKDEPDKLENPFEEWLGMDEQVYTRLREEWIESLKLPLVPEHADIPFRPLLAWALRQIPDPDERYREMHHFFRNFIDNATK